LKNPFKKKDFKKAVRFNDNANVKFQDGYEGQQQISDNYKVKKLNL